jgi:hypothetical protein
LATDLIETGSDVAKMPILLDFGLLGPKSNEMRLIDLTAFQFSVFPRLWKSGIGNRNPFFFSTKVLPPRPARRQSSKQFRSVFTKCSVPRHV